MEAVNAYYDGHVFVPTKPVQAEKNQKAIVTLLDESKKVRSRESTIKTAHAMRGMFKETSLSSGKETHAPGSNLFGMLEGTGVSTEAFMARKQEEKGLDL